MTVMSDVVFLLNPVLFLFGALALCKKVNVQAKTGTAIQVCLKQCPYKAEALLMW
jgi:hypothetical protein